MPTPVAEAFITLRPDMSKFRGDVNSFFRGRALFTGIAAAGAAVGAGLAAVAIPAASVEQQLNILQATTQASGSEMQQMAALARELGADLTLPATSSKDAAEAMTELGKSGLSINNIIGASKGVLQLSAAGQLSNAQAAEIASNALNAFGLKGTEAVRVADLLAASANASSVEVADVADSMQMAAAVFASAGIPIEDLVTLIGELGNAGIKGSDAGTSLKQMLLTVQTPSKQAAKLMEQIGFNIYEANGQMKSAREIIDNLATATAGLTPQARDFALGMIFGSDAVRAANVLLRQGVAGFDAMSLAVNRSGAAADLAAARNAGLKGAIDGLRSAVETAAIDLGTKLLPKFTEIVRGVAGAINGLHLLGPAFAIVWASAAPVLADLRDKAVAFAEFLVTNVPTMVAAILGLGTAVALALGPAGVAGLAIVSIIAAIIGLQVKWNEVFDALPIPVLEALHETSEGFAAFLDGFKLVVNGLIHGFNAIITAANVTAKAIKGAIGGAKFAAGDIEGGIKAIEEARNMPQFDLLPELPDDLGQKFREQIDDSLFAARQKAASKQTFHGRTREQLLGIEAEEESELSDAERAAAEASAALSAQLEQMALAGGGAQTTLDDLMSSMETGTDKVAAAVDELAERMKAAAQRITEQQTSDVVEGFFDAVLKGTDPETAVSAIRATQAVQDQEWAQLAAALHQRLGIEVPDEFRSMWDQMRDAQDEGKTNVVAEWQEALKQRLASVGRLPFAGMMPATGPTTNTYQISVNVPVDAAGNVNTKELTDAIVSATVDARSRATLSDVR